MQDELDQLRQENDAWQHAALDFRKAHDDAQDELERLRTALVKHHDGAKLIGGRWCAVCETLV